jgi:hypothetical protein
VQPALCANAYGSVQANRFGPGQECERIELVLLSELSNDITIRAAFKGWHGKYLSASPDGCVHFDASYARE